MREEKREAREERRERRENRREKRILLGGGGGLGVVIVRER